MADASSKSRVFRFFRALFFAAALLVDALLLLYAVELISRRNGDGILIWSVSRPDQVMINLLLLFLLLLGSVSLIPVRRGIRIVHGFLLILITISCFKLDYRGEPLLLTDFFQAKEGLDIVGKLRLSPPWYLLLSWAVLFFFIPFLFPKKRLPLPAIPRLLLSAAAFLCFAFGVSRAMAHPLTPSYQYTALFEYNGFFLGLAETRPKKELTQPQDYSRERIQEILGDYTGTYAVSPEMKPDIFFIMSESLFDLAGTTDIDFSADPLEGLYALMEEGIGAQAITPGYGGSTFYSEYEVLTGYRSKETPSRIYYDPEILHPGMKSLPCALAEQGYRTFAFHPNSGGYYNRSNSYIALGFDERYFSDRLGRFESHIGPYPSDSELFQKVLDIYREEKTVEAPGFYHIVTFQNHGAYNYKYDRRDIHVLNRENAETLNMAENYANAVLTHIEAVQEFIGELRKSDRPALVVLWGDHAPAVGFFEVTLPASNAAKAAFYTTPLFIWNNYGAEYDWPESYTATYRLGACVLHMLGMDGDGYYRWLSGAERPDMVTAVGVLEENGHFFTDEKRYQQLDEDLKALHYDRLIGEHYGEEEAP